MNSLDIQKVKNCQFGEWYPGFKHLTPKARVLDCPDQFRQYLLADGIRLPGPQESGNWSEGESDDESEDDYPEVPQEFDALVNKVIKELDSAVCPKLNWSAPRDAVWMSPTNNMKCINSHDVYILLKSSDYCTFDLTKAYIDHGPDKITLVLREWFDITPSLEFRCFVRDGKLVGATQRDINYYEFLHSHRPEIEKILKRFAEKLTTFPDNSFVFDTYIPRAISKAWLIDINPWLDRTDTLLFSWDELEVLEEFELRLLEKHDQTREFGSKPHTTNYVPHDFVDMDAQTAEDLVKAMKLHEKKE